MNLVLEIMEEASCVEAAVLHLQENLVTNLESSRREHRADRPSHYYPRQGVQLPLLVLELSRLRLRLRLLMTMLLLLLLWMLWLWLWLWLSMLLMLCVLPLLLLLLLLSV